MSEWDDGEQTAPSAFRVARRAALAAARAVITADGSRWDVYEFTHPTLDRRSGTVLVFETETTMRLVRSFPSDWRDLPDAELLQLSEGL